jgi:hypothetical protein
MLQKLLSGASIFLATTAFSQKLEQAGWQQRVDYTIAVTLDDEAHMIRGHEVMLYTNNSPDVLTEIYIHLWPNGYKNNETAFAKQRLENGSSDFYHATEEQRGWIDSLSFTVQGVAAKWELTKDIDIAKITLSQPLASGATITIATPFKVKMPDVFSRMGHEDQLYCFTQWYPKPAVYDVNGWNPMPYLDQGEFYSEFGRFDVSITVPQNYLVAATGVLQNKDEYEMLLNKSAKRFGEKDDIRETTILDEHGNVITPSSSPVMKTLRYLQDSVHDFAWFADKRFKVERSFVILPKSGRRVETWVFDVNPKYSSVAWADSAVLFYSEMLGEYPYSHATVVVTPLKAGGGMEYPTITNVVEADRKVIFHEVGHNWLYGILATNERNYPWMDESINNYYETRSAYSKRLILDRQLEIGLARNGSRAGYEGGAFERLYLRYLLPAMRNEDQSCFLNSVEYTDPNYGAIIYGKASQAFFYLQQYLGDSRFDAMMQAYYEKWKFKHPLPDDFIKHAKQFTGKDLSWFFEDIMNGTQKQDLKICSARKSGEAYQLKLKNTKAITNAPFAITGIKDGRDMHTQWYDSLSATGNVSFPKGDYDLIRIDAYESSLDLNHSNNTIRTSGMLKKWEPIRFKAVLGKDEPYTNTIFYLPIAGANLYNKTMLGVAFYNSLFYPKTWEYLVAPMYAFGTKDLAGTAEIHRYFSTYGFFKRVTLGFRAARYGSEYFVPTTYEKLEPSIRLDLTKKRMRTSPDKFIVARYVMINEQARGEGYYTNLDKAFGYADLTYVIEGKRVIDPYTAKFNYQVGNANSTFQKLSAEIDHFFNYEKPNKFFRARAFAGIFLQKPSAADDRVLYRSGGNTGIFDYTFDQSQFGRGEGAFSNSLFAQQLMPGNAQFSSPTPISATNDWLVSLNLSSTIPGIIPIRPYADGMLMNDMITSGNTGEVTYDLQFYYTAGIRLVLFNEILQVNFPIIASSQIQDVWDGKNGATGVSYAERISFVLDLNRMNPLSKIRNFSF